MTDHDLSAEDVAAGQIGRVRDGILAWFDRHRRELPWRRSRDPYHVLVSEVMLQQTQVDRVIPYFHGFLERFPTVQDLAAAPTADVIRLWAGLGYNRRAVNLQRTAQVVVRDFDGVFPSSVDALKSLPGIGAYTAGAIACFAFEQDVPFLDTNMRRVLQRVFFGLAVAGEAEQRTTLTDISADLVPIGDGWRWNQALIEFGALHCTARKPLCVVCPIQADCRSFPIVQSLIAERPLRRSSPGEESFFGSNRYFRGKVLDALRAQPNGSAGMSLKELGETVRSDFSGEHVPWLNTLVRGLQQDGLARIAEPEAVYDAAQPPEIRIKLP